MFGSTQVFLFEVVWEGSRSGLQEYTQGCQPWLCRVPVALGHSQLSAKGKVFPEVTLCASLEYLVELAQKSSFSPFMKPSIRSLCFVLTSIFLGGKKKSAFFHSKTSGWLFLGLNTQKPVLRFSRLSTPEVEGPSLPFCLGQTLSQEVLAPPCAFILKFFSSVPHEMLLCLGNPALGEDQAFEKLEPCKIVQFSSEKQKAQSLHMKQALFIKSKKRNTLLSKPNFPLRSRFSRNMPSKPSFQGQQHLLILYLYLFMLINKWRKGKRSKSGQTACGPARQGCVQ